jgi:hypothetical protein
MIDFIKIIIAILAISNLLTEQTIGRRFIGWILNTENYKNSSKIKKFFIQAFTCFNCASIWVSFIALGLIRPTQIDWWWLIPSVSLLAAYIAERKK